MKLITKNIAGVLIVLLSVCSFAEDGQKPKIEPIVNPTKVSAEASSVNSAEIDQIQSSISKIKDEQTIQLLKSQLEMQADFNEKILDTVYWFLGTTTALFAIMLGFGWFSSYRDNKRHQEILRVHIDESAEKKFVELKGYVEDLEQEKFKKIEMDLKAIGSSVSAQHKSLDASVKRLNAEIKLELAQLEYESWIGRKISANALRCTIEMIRYSSELDYNWQVSDALDRVHKLFKMNREGSLRLTLDADLSAQLMGALRELPERYNVVRESILVAMRELAK